MKRFITFFLLLSFVFNTSKLLATDYYVSALLGSNSNPGTLAQPFATIRKAADLTNPGDTVFIMNGTYTPVSTFLQSIVTINRSGTDGAYITYKAYPGHTPKLQLLTGLSFQIWRAIAIDASYIVVSGLEIEGTNQLLNYADAYQTWQNYENGIRDWNKISMYNCGSISIGNTTNAHHIIIKDCKIHDTGGGIGGFRCDYVTIENNLIYNTCWYSMYAGSGISILDPASIDNVTGYKIFIRNNVVHNNKTLIPWERIDALSDGNGIILDVNLGNGTTTFPYVGRYLVENNVSYNNGGGGVHAYKCAHVDIINNTAYNNGTVVGYPEIDANQCSDVRIYNNIMYARTGGNCNGNDANTIYDYNLYFNGPSYKNGPQDRTANPQFVSLATTAAADLQLNPTSPAINNGSNIPGQFSSTDILGVARPVGFASDKGAYEYATVIPRTEIKLFQDTTEISDNSGRYDFGDVSSTAPKTVTFTIRNIGDLLLNLTGTTAKVEVANTTGAGFSLATDAPATISPNGSVTFQVVLTPSATPGNYAGTISIANDDLDENPYNFIIAGYGYDGTKALQTISFNPLPVKVVGSPNFDPGATSSKGLQITYTSSNASVATIVAGQIRIGNAGTSTITASQAGDDTTNPARNVTQLLTVTPVLPPPGSNMVANPTFDVNTASWTFSNKNGGVSTVQSVPLTGSATNVGKVVITTLPTPVSSDNIQLSTNVFLVKDRNYIITFKASADSARTVGLRILQNASPFATIFSRNISITTSQATYGSYAYTSTYTGSVALRFFLGASTIPVYFDDVFMTEEAPIVLPTTISTFTGTVTGGLATLEWTTTAEANASEFVIEKGNDSTSFTDIGVVQAQNTSTGSSYSYTDAETVNDTVYYRLRSVDKDSSIRRTKVLALFVETPIVVPTTISAFTGTVNGGLATLGWKTTSEVNAREFVIEKGKDSTSFTDIGVVPAQNTSTGSSYSYTDAEIVKDTVYYRVRVVDKDSSVQRSKAIALFTERRPKDTAVIIPSLKIFPNPVSSVCTVSYPEATANATLTIYTAQGSKVSEYNVTTGSKQRSIDVSQLGSGTYYLVYVNNNKTITTSFIK
ncbi:MAG: T9SS type A sorting domain-containing protein [Chitinophagaceae bacterium]|nr:T9SS type A sorting domain-containing protein [Chitinophagaceae bacterium]